MAQEPALLDLAEGVEEVALRCGISVRQSQSLMDFGGFGGLKGGGRKSRR